MSLHPIKRQLIYAMLVGGGSATLLPLAAIVYSMYDDIRFDPQQKRSDRKSNRIDRSEYRDGRKLINAECSDRRGAIFADNPDYWRTGGGTRE